MPFLGCKPERRCPILISHIHVYPRGAQKYFHHPHMTFVCCRPEAGHFITSYLGCYSPQTVDVYPLVCYQLFYNCIMSLIRCNKKGSTSIPSPSQVCINFRVRQ